MRISDWSSDVCSSDLADALEQLGYQAESGPWRNFYLTGAKELRDGVAQLPTPNTASPDIVRSMTPELFFDFLAVRLNGPAAAGVEARAEARRVGKACVRTWRSRWEQCH